MKKDFCDFCPCSDCKNGASYVSHAKTSTGRWICDVCFLYDICASVTKGKQSAPCEDKNCVHRPKIVSKWTKGKKNVKS